MKSRISILALLFTGLILISCSGNQGWRYYKDEGQKEVSNFVAPDKSEYSADYEGFFMDLWDSKTYPTVIKDKLSTDISNSSPLLGVVTILNKDNFEDAYNYMDQTFVAADNPDLYLKFEKEENGNVTFYVNNSNLRLFLYGFTNGRFDEWKGASATARWNVYITYDSHGQLVSEHAYTTQSYTSDKRASVDVEAKYTLS